MSLNKCLSKKLLSRHMAYGKRTIIKGTVGGVGVFVNQALECSGDSSFCLKSSEASTCFRDISGGALIGLIAVSAHVR